MLKIQFRDKRRDAIWVVEKLYAIGSAPTNNLVIDDSSISPVHAKLITKSGKLYLKDNHSASGCFVNDQRITHKELLPGDNVRLGDVEIDILDPRESISQPAIKEGQLNSSWSLVADSSWLSGQQFKIVHSPSVIGRSSNCDITIPGTHLSRQHAEVNIQGNLLQVRDLASANGTFINDERVSEGIARPGDRLRLDVYSFRVIGPGQDKTRVRRHRPNGYNQTERKVANTPPKRWKTRPTSPGNREEPKPSTGSRLLPWFSGVLCAIMIAAIAYMLAKN